MTVAWCVWVFNWFEFPEISKESFFKSSSLAEFFISKICAPSTETGRYHLVLHLAYKLPELLASHYVYVWPDDFLVEHNSSPTSFFWAITFRCFNFWHRANKEFCFWGLAHSRWLPANPTKHLEKPFQPSILVWPPFAPAHRESQVIIRFRNGSILSIFRILFYFFLFWCLFYFSALALLSNLGEFATIFL